MSRKRLLSIVAATAALLARSPAAHAQVGFGVAGGPSFPAGALGGVVDRGFHGGLILELGIPLLPLGVRADALFQQLPGTVGREDFRQLSATANVRIGLLPIPLISTYLTVGVGFYSSDFHGEMAGTPVLDGGWSSAFGVNAGLGVRVNLLVVRPFVEARYHHVQSRPSRAFVPVTVGIFF